MKFFLLPKFTAGLALFCLALIIYIAFVKLGKESAPALRVLAKTSTETGFTYTTGEARYANLAFAFIKNYENNELDKSLDLMAENFIFENAHGGSVIGNREFVRMFKNYRKEFLKVQQHIDSWIVLAPPYVGKGPVVHIWFKEILTRRDGKTGEKLYSELFQFNEEGKISFLKLSDD